MRIETVICIVFVLVSLSSSYSETLEQCVGSAPNTKRKQSKIMSLFYGEAGFEVFNAVHSSDIKYINLLAKCVQTTSGVESAFHNSSRGLMAASNVTDLTSSFSKFLPRIVDSIHRGIKFGFSKARFRRRKTNFDGVSIKSVYHLHTNIGNLEEFLDRIHKIRAEEKAAKEVFIVYDKVGFEKLVAENERKWDPETDKYMDPYVTVEPSSVRYFIVIPLNERSEFSGGEMLARKTPNPNHYTLRPSSGMAASLLETEEQNEEEEEEVDEEENEEQREQALIHSIQDDKRPKFDKFTRFTPDLGSILVLNGAHDVGIRPITHGERKALLIEYEDAAPEQADRAEL